MRARASTALAPCLTALALVGCAPALSGELSFRPPSAKPTAVVTMSSSDSINGLFEPPAPGRSLPARTVAGATPSTDR